MGKLCKIVLFSALLSICFVSRAQTGILDIDVRAYGDRYDDEHVTIQIFKEDSVISEYKEFVRDLVVFTDSLTPGVYNVRYFINFQKDVIGEIKSIDIIEGKTTTIVFHPPTLITSDTLSYFDTGGYALINLSTGNNFINPENDIFGGYNQFGMYIGGTSPVFKYLEMGQQFGSSMSYTYFNESKSLRPSFDKETEKYYYWSLNYMIFLRSTFYDNSKKRKGLFMDAGISYNFPLLFRHVLVKGDTKTITKKIHHYNDFSAIFKLGFEPIAFTFEYRLTNFLDKFYPEQPKMKAGISFIFGD